MDNPYYLDIGTTGTLLRKKQLSVPDLAEAILDRVQSVDPKINSFICLNPGLVDKAQKLQQDLDSGKDRGPLHGVPFSVKDLILTQALPTSAGSKAYFGQSLRDAPVVKKLVRAGALFIGKNNLHEFAYGVTNDNQHFGPARNPWDPKRMTGGSSGGSAAAVASGLGAFSIGSDTRGSIRIPSSLCGTCGFKPSYKLLSTRDVVPLSPTLDHVGPITRNCQDLEAVMEALTGPQSARQSALVQEKRIGICSYFLENLDPAVDDALGQATQTFEKLGFQLIDISIPLLAEALEASRIIAAVEAITFHHSLLERVGNLYGQVVRERLIEGSDISGREYLEAMQVRKELTRAYQDVFRKVDCILAATTPVTAPLVGKTKIRIRGTAQPIVPSFTRFNAPQNMTGYPALTLPCGFKKGLPIGLQLIGPLREEAQLIRLGQHFQSATDWHQRHPGI